MKNKLTWVLSLLAFGLAPLSTAQGLTAKEVVKRADDNLRGNTSEAEITIQIVRPTWTREMKVKAWTKSDDFTLIH
ncbi:hypothetical protein PY092_13480 [Muricauda sp. 334s03]|uniref:Outer membrane lipoprotein-sorting protein n=1 Tax=Flagellimonas yonaguniensis TaxID=3031325 RepID=A0ABT5Y141_9FLAO|nr:hypothetical protein [[Muricauda] yonaguniensis]MDF0717169.1 hypothetical protein [[Muricauda] yonaguniensis]